MGSVLTIRECPRCGGAAWADYYYRSGEEYVTCEWCGYYRELTRQDGQLVAEDTMGYAAVEFREPGRTALGRACFAQQMTSLLLSQTVPDWNMRSTAVMWMATGSRWTFSPVKRSR